MRLCPGGVSVRPCGFIIGHSTTADARKEALVTRYIPDHQVRFRTGAKRSARHRPTALFASTARLRTPLHLLVAVRHTTAGIPARLADLGTDAADVGVMLRPAAHEVRRGRADHRAVLHDPLVLKRSMIPTHSQAMVHAPQALLSAPFAVLDTFEYLLIGDRCGCHD